MVGIEYSNLWIKQILWYVIGIILAYSMMSLGNKFFYHHAWILYIIGVIALFLVLFIGADINNARCWFRIKFIGTIQPSEFMKIFLIIIETIILTFISMCAFSGGLIIFGLPLLLVFKPIESIVNIIIFATTFLPMSFAWHFAPKIADKIL